MLFKTSAQQINFESSPTRSSRRGKLLRKTDAKQNNLPIQHTKPCENFPSLTRDTKLWVEEKKSAKVVNFMGATHKKCKEHYGTTVQKENKETNIVMKQPCFFGCFVCSACMIPKYHPGKVGFFLCLL